MTDAVFKATEAEIKEALNRSLEQMKIRFQYNETERDEPVSIKKGSVPTECRIYLEY